MLAYAGYDLAAIDRRWQLLDEQTQHLRLAMLDLQQHQEALSSETRDLHQHQQNLFSETQAYKTLLLRSVDAIRKQAESIRNLTYVDRQLRNCIRAVAVEGVGHPACL